MHFVRKAAGLALALGVSLASPMSLSAWNITPIVYPGGTYTSVIGINNKGEVLGDVMVDGKNRAFIYQHGVFTDFAGPPGADYTSLYDASDFGHYVGSFGRTLDSGVGYSTGFIFDQSGFRTVEVAGATGTYVQGISPNGRFVTGRWYREGSTTLDASGQSQTDTVVGQGFIFDRANNSMTFVGAASPKSLTILQGVNDAGIVAGSVRVVGTGQPSRAFSYDLNTGITNYFEPPGLTGPRARDIDANGNLVGLSDGAGASFSQRNPDVSDLLSFEAATLASTAGWDGSGFHVMHVQGTNDAGALTGYLYADDADGNSLFYKGFVAVPVPEPETYTMLIAGLALVGVLRRRRLRG